MPLHAGFTCPNRDGTIGRGGCHFCHVGAFSEENDSPLADQLLSGGERIQRARLYLAYFQSYTNTYAELDRLRAMYEQALSSRNVVGLCVGTRPDCVPDAVLDLLAGYRQNGAEVWLELGLQSAFDETLRRVNRGHGFSEFADTLRRANARDVPVCAHLIVGLPGETAEQSLVTVERTLATGVRGLKLHPLMIVRGSHLAKAYARNAVALPSFQDYVTVAADIVRLTPAPVVFHRVAASARAPSLVAPEWCHTAQTANNAIAHNLARNGAQGALTDEPFLPLTEN